MVVANKLLIEELVLKKILLVIVEVIKEVVKVEFKEIYLLKLKILILNVVFLVIGFNMLMKILILNLYK